MGTTELLIYIWLFIICGFGTFIIGALFGYRAEQVPLFQTEIVTEDEKGKEEEFGKYVMFKVKVGKIWDMWWKRFKRFLGKFVWVVEGIFLTTTATGLDARKDFAKIDKDGKLRWMDSRNKHQIFHPSRIQLPGGKSLAIFLDEVPLRIKEGKLLPISIQVWLQMLSDAAVMAKHRYPKRLGGTSTSLIMVMIAGLLICAGFLLFRPQIESLIGKFVKMFD